MIEVVFDSWRFKSEALRLEDECALVMVDVPQNAARMTQASENLHRLIVEPKLRHPGHRDLDRAVAAAVAKPSPGGRGWRLDKSHYSRTIDSLVALAMCCERATIRSRQVQLLGFV